MTLTSRINTTLPGYLFDLREKQRTGLLTANPGPYEKKFCFIKGELAVIKKYFPEKEFIEWLLETRRLEPPLRTSQQVLGSEITSSAVGLIIEHGFLSAEETLSLVKDFFIRQLANLISTPKITVDFTEETYLPEEILLDRLSTTDIILNGIRNLNKIEDFLDYLPGDHSIICRNKAADNSRINLSDAERYLLNLLSKPMTVEQLLKTSWLGPTETRKTLFLLSCLKLVAQNQPAADGEPENNSIPDMEESFKSFNEKHLLIYKYLAKQLGPVAINLVEKCYREVQEVLDPIFQNLEIKVDGSFELRPMLRFSLNDLSLKEKKVLRRGFDEILLASLLMVRKNLGSRHEETLLRIIKRNGQNGDLS